MGGSAERARVGTSDARLRDPAGRDSDNRYRRLGSAIGPTTSREPIGASRRRIVPGQTDREPTAVTQTPNRPKLPPASGPEPSHLKAREPADAMVPLRLGPTVSDVRGLTAREPTDAGAREPSARNGP